MAMKLAFDPSNSDKARLEHFAQLFGITVAHVTGGRMQLKVTGPRGDQMVDLPSERAYIRLLAELCSVTSNWLCFSQTEHCALTFLGQSDARLERLVQLHEVWVAEGSPEHAVTQLPALHRHRTGHL
jgi:hypothetical protein